MFFASESTVRLDSTGIRTHLSPGWWRLVATAACWCLLGACSAPRTPETGPDEFVGEPADRTAPPPGLASDEGRDGPPFRKGALWYRIDVSDSRLDITVRLLKPADRSSFFLPTSEHLREPAARAITIRGASGPNGALPLDQIPDEHRLDIDSEGLEWVELGYTVDLDAFPDDAPRPLPDTLSGSVLAYVSSILVVPSKRVVEEIREIPIEIHAPENWKVLASWTARDRRRSKTRDRNVHGFVAADVRELRDAFFVAGAKIQQVRRDDLDLTVAFPSEVDRAREPVTSAVGRILRTYRDQFGEIGETLVFVRPAREHGSGRVPGTAKRGGFVVRLPSRRPLRDDVQLLVAHEAFHLWNGHRLTPTPKSEERTRWFKEGVTHYIAIKTLYEIGIFDLEDVRDELAKSAFFYRRNPASQGGRASRLDLHRLPYDRGVLLAVALDDSLARCSSNRHSLSDWIGTLLEDDVDHYDTRRLRSAFDEIAGTGCKMGDRTWRRHVTGRDALDPRRLFERVGLHYLEAESVEETELLPLEGSRRAFESLFDRNSPASPPRSTLDRADTSTSENSP